MTELLQNIIDGHGRGSIYALLALGVAVVFGVMHLLNFAVGEIDHANDAVHHGVAQGDQGVDAGLHDALDQELEDQHVVRPVRSV